jgi:hypothetical protein
MRAVLILVFGVVCATPVQTTPAAAQTFISATGNDANGCTRTAPCRTLQRGINATGVGRELTILDSGEYGRAAIAKSITVTAAGISATIRNLDDEAAAILIDNPNARVTLRGLFLTGGGTGEDGVNIVEAAAVHMENCQIERFLTGIRVVFPASAELFVSGSIVRDNIFDGLGVYAPGSKLTVESSRFENNGDDGVDARTAQSATIRGSVASGNGGNGFSSILEQTMSVAHTVATHNRAGFLMSGFATLDSVVARGNGQEGLFVGSFGAVRLANSVITNNTTGVHNNGTVLTRGDNMIDGNATNTAGSPFQALPPS